MDSSEVRSATERVWRIHYHPHGAHVAEDIAGSICHHEVALAEVSVIALYPGGEKV